MKIKVPTVVIVACLSDLGNSAQVPVGITCKSFSRRSPQAPIPKPTLPVSTGSENLADDVEDVSSTQYNNYISHVEPDDHYANGTQKSTTSSTPNKVDDSGDYSSYYPPPPSLSLSPFNEIHYPLPLTGVIKHCPPPEEDDGMTVAFPSDLYTGKSGPKNKLSLTVVDAFHTHDRTELRRTVLLGEDAWREATGNSIINKFESWPIRWFFRDATMQHDTVEGDHENTDGEGDDASGNSTMFYQESDRNSTTSSGCSSNSSKNEAQAESFESNEPPPEKDFDPTPNTKSAHPQNKRNLLSRRSSKSLARQQNLMKLN
ncbi:hypothetical protein CROQUDRAFT_715861 [Cronartium quercuum f. sp. fusiforme G11]|uniref:Secreted protein n=1 Tax=Cronartium quercuum f. sp. fusiforme G11 TaxID=708437 RepID=A0A9P6NLZ3_9BASI|nr:hypothetical protein CROQUDRAFT_715861 [Cronartium quercuum f. sp. fusiforme G11]